MTLTESQFDAVRQAWTEWTLGPHNYGDYGWIDPSTNPSDDAIWNAMNDSGIRLDLLWTETFRPLFGVEFYDEDGMPVQQELRDEIKKIAVAVQREYNATLPDPNL